MTELLKGKSMTSSMNESAPFTRTQRQLVVVAMKREHLCVLLVACLVEGLTLVSVAAAGDKGIQECAGKLWSLHFDDVKYERRAFLHVKVKNHLEVEAHSTAILSCVDILVSGTGEKRARLQPNAGKTMRFNISLQKPVKEEDFERLERDSVRQCVLSLQLEPVVGVSGCDTPSVQEGGAHCHHQVAEQECSISIRTFIGRILPHCGHKEEVKKLLVEVDVLKEDGKVHVHLGTSPNEILAFDPWCSIHESPSPSLLTHDTEANQDKYTLALNEERSGPFVLSVEFRPNCSDPAINAAYQGVPMTGCRLGVYRYCQSGMDQVLKRDIEFNSKATHCYPLPSALDMALMQLKMHFGIDSIPVVVEIAWLVFNAALYLVLVPLALFRCVRTQRMKLQSLVPGVGIKCQHASCSYQVRPDPEMERLLAAMKCGEDTSQEDEGFNTLQEEQETGVEGGGQEAEASGSHQVEVELHPRAREEQT